MQDFGSLQTRKSNCRTYKLYYEIPWNAGIIHTCFSTYKDRGITVVFLITFKCVLNVSSQWTWGNFQTTNFITFESKIIDSISYLALFIAPSHAQHIRLYSRWVIKIHVQCYKSAITFRIVGCNFCLTDNTNRHSVCYEWMDWYMNLFSNVLMRLILFSVGLSDVLSIVKYVETHKSSNKTYKAD